MYLTPSKDQVQGKWAAITDSKGWRGRIKAKKWGQRARLGKGQSQALRSKVWAVGGVGVAKLREAASRHWCSGPGSSLVGTGSWQGRAKKQSRFVSSQGWRPHQPDFLQHIGLPDPGFCLVTNIAEGHMVSLEPKTKWSDFNLGWPRKSSTQKELGRRAGRLQKSTYGRDQQAPQCPDQPQAGTVLCPGAELASHWTDITVHKVWWAHFQMGTLRLDNSSMVTYLYTEQPEFACLTLRVHTFYCTIMSYYSEE